MDKEGNSALMAAASTAGDRSKTKATSKLGVLEFLLDEGADVEMASHKGYTSLVWAARYVCIAYCIAMHYSVRPIAVMDCCGIFNTFVYMCIYILKRTHDGVWLLLGTRGGWILLR